MIYQSWGKFSEKLKNVIKALNRPRTSSVIDQISIFFHQMKRNYKNYMPEILRR